MKKKRFISMLICIAMVVTMAPCIVSAADGVAINATNFPDENFRNYVSSDKDTNSDGFLSETEIANITSINVTDMSISTLEGIEYFTAITILDCGSNNLTTLDVSNNTALTFLGCSNNNLTTLDVSNNTALEYLDCGSNNLTTLDVSNNTSLTSLWCGGNNLTTLDVSRNTALEELYCYDNNLTTLDVSNNSALEFLACCGNNISTLDISCVPELLGVMNEGSESVYTFNGYEVRQFIDDESGLACDLSTTIVTNPPVTEEPTVEPSVSPTVTDTPSVTPTVTDTPTVIPTVTDTPSVAPTVTVEPDLPSVNREQAESFVTRCYEIALGRAPELEGLTDWTDSLVDREISGSQFAYGVIFSPEFQNKDLSDEEYVEYLYLMLLDRPSDEEGKENWLSLLEGGASREVIFAGFVNSVKYFNLCRTYGLNAGYYVVGVDMNRQGAVNGFVDRLYGYCLGRSGDQGGQQNWVTQLINGSATGAQVAYGFFFSPEFMNNNYSNEVFVTILYNVCLNRAPDPDGLNNWVTALDNGADRLEVFRGFAHSDEFTGICNSYGIVRGSI